ncbi:isoamylase early set domain-containing protein [Salinibius halmophilus]|uniref:isoamylase early set domain-containing protein n=1 Tax=Salinibius halmophilus TaxID=1853216 RepID=UPI000E671749|nr:isoamylase early set domain-containing protein [Salinibius halmophilus]
MPVAKRYLKSKPVAKCTFKLPKDAAPSAQAVMIVGDFTDWLEKPIEMKKLKSGDFKAELDIEVGKEYQYRYLIDGETWENDWEADAYAQVPELGVENSVLQLTQ